MSRRCQITGKKNNTANNVSHSNHRTKRLQKANIISKRVYLPSKKQWVILKLSTQALRTLEKVGVEEYLRKTGTKV
ncbi:MAG: 50S ribosomal protein L28 [Candidatus Sumerlaeia bacterium]